MKVLSKIQEANESIKEQKIEEAQLKITEGVEIIKHRQKLIRLAESSEAWWRAVDEYVKNPIAREESQQSTDTGGEDSQRGKGKETQGFVTRPYPTPLSSTQTTSKESTWRPAHSYRCIKRGHWRKDCTEKLDDNKIRTFTTQNHLMVHTVNMVNCKTGTQRQSSNPLVLLLWFVLIVRFFQWIPLTFGTWPFCCKYFYLLIWNVLPNILVYINSHTQTSAYIWFM